MHLTQRVYKNIILCKLLILFQVCGKFVSKVLLILATGMRLSFMVAGGYLKKNITLSTTSCYQVKNKNSTFFWNMFQIVF